MTEPTHRLRARGVEAVWMFDANDEQRLGYIRDDEDAKWAAMSDEELFFAAIPELIRRGVIKDPDAPELVVSLFKAYDWRGEERPQPALRLVK